MNNKVIQKIKTTHSGIVYLLVGASSNILDILLFALLVRINVNYLVASTISTVIALFTNFVLHKALTFNVEGRTRNQAGRFVFSISFNYLVAQLLLYLIVTVLGIDEVIAKVVSLVFVSSYNYFLLKKWVFKE